MAHIRRTSPEPRMEMTPLIDVVFLLLTFFIFAMVMMVRANVLDLKLPDLASAEHADQTPLIAVSLDTQGQLYIDSEPVAWEEFVAVLSDRQKARPDAHIAVAVDTDGGARADVFRLIDLLSAGGFERITLLGRQDGQVPAGGESDE